MADKIMTNQELNEEKRKRQLAIIKASNQMLKEAKETALKNNADPITRAELEQRFDVAMQQNNDMAKSYLHATLDEVENSTFREVDELYVKKYNERLEKKGLSDEELHRKDSATVTIGKNGEEIKSVPRRRRRGAKKDVSEIVRLDNEKLGIHAYVKQHKDNAFAFAKDKKDALVFQHEEMANNAIESMCDGMELRPENFTVESLDPRADEPFDESELDKEAQAKQDDPMEGVVSKIMYSNNNGAQFMRHILGKKPERLWYYPDPVEKEVWNNITFPLIER